MRYSAFVCAALLVLVTLPTVARAQTGIDTADIANVQDPFADLKLGDREPPRGDTLLAELDGDVSRGQVSAMITAIEGALSNGKSLITVRVVDDSGKRVSLIDEVGRQLALWDKAWRRAHLAVQAGEPLPALTPVQWTEDSNLDDGVTEALLAAVIDDDVSIEHSTPGVVDPLHHKFVADRYRDLHGAIQSYNNFTGEVLSQSSEIDQDQRAAELSNAVARINARLRELKKLFIEG